MCGASVLVECLFRRQNRDGGWGYNGADSWTEPTSLAALALASAHATVAPYARACQWILKQQRNDGGWAPHSTVTVSTAVTSLAMLAVASYAPEHAYRAGTSWLLSQVKPDLNTVQCLQYWLSDMPERETTMGGSPWFPGTAAWVAPTAASILALADTRHRIRDSNIDEQIRRAKAYLLSRQCPDGGWNHGGTEYRSPNAPSYPEMTGIALLALDGVQNPQIESALNLARTLLHKPASAEGQACLRLALAKHRQPDLLPPELPLPLRTTRDISLQLLAMSTHAAENKFMTRTA